MVFVSNHCRRKISRGCKVAWTRGQVAGRFIFYWKSINSSNALIDNCIEIIAFRALKWPQISWKSQNFQGLRPLTPLGGLQRPPTPQLKMTRFAPLGRFARLAHYARLEVTQIFLWIRLCVPKRFCVQSTINFSVFNIIVKKNSQIMIYSPFWKIVTKWDAMLLQSGTAF